MSGKSTKKARKRRAVSRGNPRKTQQFDLAGSIRPSAKKYGVPVLKNLALAGAILISAFAIVSQSDRISLFAQQAIPNSIGAEPNGGTARIVGNNVPVRSVPKMNAKILERAVWGEIVEVLSKEGEWAQIRKAKNDVIGWISQADLKF